ncbi:hypothetical protein, partial [Poseidonibacter sp.]|uniref:hypothetical protein n=1 Tax=Poseidonibacter sp. TaxID=2321188 RepID=UPI003C72397B
GDDDFTLDFTNIDSFNIDGGSDTSGDKVNLTGSTNSISSDTNLANVNAFDNIEEIDFSNLTLNVNADNSDGGTNAEFNLTADLIKNWTDNANSLKLTLTSDDASKLEFTDKLGNKIGGDDSDSSAITDNTTYTLSDGTNDISLVIDIV